MKRSEQINLLISISERTIEDVKEFIRVRENLIKKLRKELDNIRDGKLEDVEIT